MLMEYLEGQTLEQTLCDRGNQPMPLAQAWPILDCVGTALAAAHEQQLVHSDVKPSNVFVCSKGAIKVLDFGIARQYKKSVEATVGSWDAEVLGAYTPPYASLEQIQGLPADPRDDIYAFGCLAYRVLSGVHPFGEASADHAMGSKLAPRPLDQLSGRQWQALKHTLAFKRNDRTANIRDFLREFAPPSPWRRFRVPILLAGLALAGGVVYLSKEYFRDYYEGQMLGPGRGAVVHRKLTPAQQREVDDDLYLAKDSLSGAQLSEQAEELAYVLSEGANNVNQILDSVLEIDPGNAQALAMKSDIANLYTQKARLEMNAGHTTVAATLIRNGRKAEPSNRELFRLQQQLCSPNPSVCAWAQN
jgi:serine/threonine protein kinase